MHRNAPNKALMFSMAASLLDVFARNEPICRELRPSEETRASIRPLFWSYLCNLHCLAHQQHSTCPKSFSLASRYPRHTPYAHSGFTLSSEIYTTSDVTRGSQWGCSKHGTRLKKINIPNRPNTSNKCSEPRNSDKQHGYLDKNNSRHTVIFFPFSRHAVNFLDVSRHTLNPIETLSQGCFDRAKMAVNFDLSRSTSNG